MNPANEVDRLLWESGAALLRNKKHEVWGLPNGRIFVRSKTPSDFRAHDRQLSQLRAALGINGERGLPGERRERRNKPGRHGEPRTIADQLVDAGIADDPAEAELRAVIEELRQTQESNRRKREALRDLNAEVSRCWMCRLRRWWQYSTIARLLKKERESAAPSLPTGGPHA